MRLQASEVLGADLRVVSPDAIGTAYDEEAARRGLSTARVTSMLSVVLKDEATQLANVHAVTDAYPLRGAVREVLEAARQSGVLQRFAKDFLEQTSAA